MVNVFGGDRMDVLFLGTASCFPTPKRGVSCTALSFIQESNVWLFDCGEGSQIQIMKSRLKAGRISRIFITHLHGDHMFGLPGLLCTLGNGGDIEKKEIHVYGPLGLRKYISTVLELARSPLGYKLHIHELIPKADQYPSDWNDWKVDHERDYPEPKEESVEKIPFDLETKSWPLFETSTVKVCAGPITHRIPSFAYIISEKDQLGNLDVAKLKSLGIPPGPPYAQLRKGQSVTSPSGEVVNPLDVCSVKPGKKVVITGDTSDPKEIEHLSQNCSLLVHEATMQESLREKCVEFGHSTPRMAAEFAVRIGAKRLCLNHVSPRYKPFQNIESLSASFPTEPSIDLIRGSSSVATSAATAATTKTRAGVGIGSKKDDDATESQDTSTTTHSATETSDVVKDDHHREEGGAAGGGGGGDETAKILLDEAKSYLAEMQSDIQVEIAEDFYTIRLK